MNDFRELPDVSALARLVAVEYDVETNASAVLHLLRDAPGAHEYLRVQVEYPRPRPGVMSYLVPKTRIFFNVERCKQLWGDAMVALAVYAMTQSTPAAFFAATSRQLYDSLSLLTEDEAEVVRDIFSLSGGYPYQNPIQEAELTPRFADTRIPLEDVLDQLERKGMIAKHRGGRLALVL